MLVGDLVGALERDTSICSSLTQRKRAGREILPLQRRRRDMALVFEGGGARAFAKAVSGTAPSAIRWFVPTTNAFSNLRACTSGIVSSPSRRPSPSHVQNRHRT